MVQHCSILEFQLSECNTCNMINEPVLSIVRACAVRLQALGASGAFVFGSRARGDHRPDSDLDVLIDDSDTLSLYRLVGIQHLLEDLTGLAVHVATRDSFSTQQLSAVEQDAIKVL